jgi:hypothetical protein
MKRFLKKLLLVVSAAIMSTMLVMCGPTGMDMVGDAMVDAGNMLRDGSDGTMPDAMAQDSCATNCTSGGVLRVMTADTDPAQLVTGIVQIMESTTPASPGQEIVAGPLVLTDVRLALPFAFTAAGTGYMVNLFISEDCGETIMPSTTSMVGHVVRYTNTATSGTVFVTDLEGVRIHIPPGSFLCGYRTGAAGTLPVRYAGFRPYD